MQQVDQRPSSPPLPGPNFSDSIERFLCELLDFYRRVDNLYGHASFELRQGHACSVLEETAILLSDSRHAILNATILMSASLCCQKVDGKYGAEVLDALRYMTAEYDRLSVLKPIEI